MTFRKCVIDDCGRPHAALDMCDMHYHRALRLRRHNGPDRPHPPPACPHCGDGYVVPFRAIEGQITEWICLRHAGWAGRFSG